ncbi:MAG TPA: hypothetical protein VGQ84_08305 [Gaiellaceae bacterium]|jgi:hypothetical protein|nr:hypothetical protein [Gaiellaceae bacterium]
MSASARRSFAAAAAGLLVLTLVPWGESPLRRLAGGDGDGRDPTFDVRMDPAPLRNACRTKIATYYVDAHTETQLAQGNAKAAGQLYLSCSFPVQDPSRAETTLRFRAGRIQVLHRID